MDGRTDGDRWTDRDRWTDSHRKTNRQSDGGQVKGRGDRGLTINRSLASRVKFEFEKRCGVWWTMKTRTNTITHHSSVITSYSTSNLFDRLFVHLYFKLLIVCYVLLFQGIRLMSKCAKRVVVWRHHFSDVITCLKYMNQPFHCVPVTADWIWIYWKYVTAKRFCTPTQKK